MSLSPPPAPSRHPINFRSVALGLLGTILICGLTPYNDYALNNTWLVGNNLPLGVVMLLFLFVLAVNGPLNRFFPSLAFSSSELSVMLAMVLISCTLPSSGLMRFLPLSLIGPFWHARSSFWEMEVLRKIHLAKWIFPKFTGSGPEEWSNSRVVKEYLTGTDSLDRPPYSAWIVPLFTWLIFLMALYGALMCMVAIVRRQWFENERLAFPLAQFYLPLIEQPPQGTWLASLLRGKLFWFGFGSVFILHLWNGLHEYVPQTFPQIPLQFNLLEVFTERPWSFAGDDLKRSTIYFTVVGVMFFAPQSVSFSIWFFFILSQVQQMIFGSATGDPEWHGETDRHFGAIAAFALAILWVGRRHWMMVLRQGLRGQRPGEPRGRYLSYPAAFWGLIGCIVIMVAWLWLAGSTVFGAVVMILLLLLLFFVITRIIAETGILQGQLWAPIQKPFDTMNMIGSNHPALAALKDPVPPSTYYLSGMLEAVHYDFREPMPVYASHAIKVADETIYQHKSMREDGPSERRAGRGLLLAMLLALLVGYFVSFSSTLWTAYRHPVTLDASRQTPINSYAVGVSTWAILGPSDDYIHHHYEFDYSPRKQLAIGFLFTAFLAAMRLRFVWWPLHPIGFLLLNRFPSSVMWFSIFLGWMAKAIILKFGGARMYVSAKSFFLGLIVGESMAAAFWLVMALAMNAMHHPYHTVNIMPR